jgi:hypothetical protein
MSAANPNPMEKSMVSLLVVANAGGGSPLPCGVREREGNKPDDNAVADPAHT